MEPFPTPRSPILNGLRSTPVALLCLIAGAGAACLADPLAGVKTTTLPNGLTVALKADRTRPVVAVQMLYKVGARNEPIGLTGISHFLEHMLFRGTRSFPLEDVTGVIERAGGEWHGYTYLDCTTYFEAAPRDLLPTLLRLEAERMTGARLAPDEVEPERGAVFQEYRGYQLDARSELFDAVTATLFLAHPYRNNTMGWESDLAGITHGELVEFYRSHYGPANAILAIAGDFDESAVESRVRSLFGAIPAGGADTRIRTVEPPLSGARRLTLRRPGAEPALMVSFLAPPPARPREYAALMVLDAILGSAKGLSFYHHSSDLTAGAGVDPGSRLEALIEGGPADHVGTAFVPTLYPYQYSIYVTPRQGRAIGEIEPILFEALSEAAAGVTGEEVRRAAARIRAVDLLQTDSPVEVAHEMAFWTAIGGLDRRRAILEQVGSVTPEEVRTLAAGFQADHAVLGVLLPERAAPQAPAGREGGRAAAGAIGAVAPPAGGATRAASPREPKLSPKPAKAPVVETISLPRGARAIIDARPDLRTFVLRLALEAARGAAAPHHPSVLQAAAAALHRDREVRRHLAAEGVQLSVEAPGDGLFAERDTLQIQMAGPASALDGALGVLGPALGRALLAPPAADAWLSDEPGERALQVLARATEPASPGPESPRATIRSDPRASIAIVSRFSPDSLAPRLKPLIESLPAAFGHHPGSPAAKAGAPGPSFVPGRRTASLPDISQGHLLMAVPGDDDAAAQEAVAWILHHNYSGRLGVKAIAETGLVYDMDSESVRRGTRIVFFKMGADPAALPRLESLLAGVLDQAASGLTEKEVAGFRSFASGSIAVRLADPVQAARLYGSALLRGEDDRAPAACARSVADLTRDRVSAAARRMLDPERRLTIVIERAAP